jgi:hypothetical protein
LLCAKHDPVFSSFEGWPRIDENQIVRVLTQTLKKWTGLLQRSKPLGTFLTIPFPQHFARTPIDGAVEHLIYPTELSN